MIPFILGIGIFYFILTRIEKGYNLEAGWASRAFIKLIIFITIGAPLLLGIAWVIQNIKFEPNWIVTMIFLACFVIGIGAGAIGKIKNK